MTVIKVYAAMLSALIIGLGMVLTAPTAAHSLKKLEGTFLKRERYAQIVHDKAPAFTLKDADGNKVALADFRGKVVVLHFLYTHCPDVCPLHSEKIASVQQSVNSTPMKGLVKFLSITTDPVRDTPAVMKAHGPDHGLDPVNWMFLSSGVDQPAATRDLAGRFGFKFTLGKDGYQMHGIVTMLIDKSGILRAKYHGLKFGETNMIIHINALSNDTH